MGKCDGAVVGARKMLGWAGETAHCAGLETCPGPLQLVAALGGLGVAHPGQLMLLLEESLESLQLVAALERLGVTHPGQLVLVLVDW